MKKLTMLLGTALLVAGVTNVTACELTDAIDRAMEGPDGKPVQFAQHRFGVKEPKMTEKTKRGHTLVGQVTRLEVKDKAAEVVSYRVMRDKGAIKSIHVQIDGGVWLPVSDAVMNALGGYRTGDPMPEEKQQEVTGALKKLGDEAWLRAAEALIALIAVRHC